MLMTASRKKIILIACLVGLLTLVVVWKWHTSRRERQEQQLLASLPTVTLHSVRPYHEVRVPFRRKEGWVNLTADCSGKAVDCILDTGHSLAVWPRSLGLTSADAHFRETQFSPYSYMPPRIADWRILSDLKFGDYEMRNCTSIAYDARSDDPHRSSTKLIIGYPALAQVVLTIDYRKQELVVRDQNYDVTRLPSSPGNYLLNMVVNPEDPQKPRRQPIVEGTIAGYPVHLVVDTGLAAGSVALGNPKLIAAVKQASGGKLLYNWTTGGRALPDAVWSVGSLADQSPVDLKPGFVSDGIDGVLGYEVLRNYRITIDYGRQKVLLEWNPIMEDAQFRIQARKSDVFHSPRDPFVHIELGKAYLFANQYQDAQQEFARAVSLDQSNAFAHFKLGQCFYDLGHYSNASREFAQAIRLEPTDAFSLLWQGKALSQQGKMSAAHEAWQAAIAQDKTTAIAPQAQKLAADHL